MKVLCYYFLTIWFGLLIMCPSDELGSLPDLINQFISWFDPPLVVWARLKSAPFFCLQDVACQIRQERNLILCVTR